MDRSEIKERIMKVFRNNGVFIKDDETAENEIMDIDSLTYVSVMVDMESEFDTELDEFVIAKQDVTYASFIDQLADLLEQKIWAFMGEFKMINIASEIKR